MRPPLPANTRPFRESFNVSFCKQSSLFTFTSELSAAFYFQMRDLSQLLPCITDSACCARVGFSPILLSIEQPFSKFIFMLFVAPCYWITYWLLQYTVHVKWKSWTTWPELCFISDMLAFKTYFRYSSLYFLSTNWLGPNYAWRIDQY